MNYFQPTFNRRCLAVLFCIATAIWPSAFAGCQSISEPASSGRSNEAVLGPQDASVLLIEQGPILTVTNEYMDPIETPWGGTFVRIPRGVALAFCWSARPATGGGEIAAYRYGWDIADLEDPEEWEVYVTPYDGSEVCAPSKVFNTWGVHLFAVEVIDDAGVKSRITVAVEVVTGPVSFDVMPGTCKNPLSIERKGQIKTAISGMIGLDVSEIDVSSLYLWIDGNTVQPLRCGVKDISSPRINVELCDCPPANPDGVDDLEIVFAASEITRALGQVSKDETRRLTIRGELLGGTDFSIADCVTIVGNPRAGDEPALYQKDAVLIALQNGYNEKNFQKVSRIFDDDFVFFFSDADYHSGKVPVWYWDKEDELTATANILNVDIPADALVSGSITDTVRHAGASEEATWGSAKWAFFDGYVSGAASAVVILSFPQGEDNWTSMLPPDPGQYPGEVWYEKTVSYYLHVQAGDYTIVAPFLRASFVVRFSETKGYWQLAQWRDDI